MNKTIIHVDMDAFYAAVEIRDDPHLAGIPLIIGALPHERGVVSTCSYEARKFGVHSGMSIKDAYRHCPQGTYMHPNMEKYKEVSLKLHQIWCSYTDIVEYISLDEGYLDVTGSVQMFNGARRIAAGLKERTKEETGLTCSVGIGYSMASAKLASEEEKPDGFFEILSQESFIELIIDRNVRVLYSIGNKTAEKLKEVGIRTVRDIHRSPQKVIDLLGRHGKLIVEVAEGIDDRSVTPYYEAEEKSIGREHTFQLDVTDFSYLQDMLVLLARDLSKKIRFAGLYCRTITLKVTYKNMKSVTRSMSGNATNRADEIYEVASSLLNRVGKKPVRLIGIRLENLSETILYQPSLAEFGRRDELAVLEGKMLDLQRKYGANIIKTGLELAAEKRLKKMNQEKGEDTK